MVALPFLLIFWTGMTTDGSTNICPSCGSTVPEGSANCPVCGNTSQGSKKKWNKTSRGFEWQSRTEILGWPLIHVAFGKDPATGRFRVAKGIIAVGQFAVGLITFAQVGIGLLFGFGQCIFGFTAVAQVAFGLYFGLGQISTGWTAIGQICFGYYVLAQVGYGAHLWTQSVKDPEAIRYFHQLWESVVGFLS